MIKCRSKNLLQERINGLSGLASTVRLESLLSRLNTLDLTRPTAGTKTAKTVRNGRCCPALNASYHHPGSQFGFAFSDTYLRLEIGHARHCYGQAQGFGLSIAHSVMLCSRPVS